MAGLFWRNAHVRVAGRRLVDIGLVDDEQDLVLVLADIWTVMMGLLKLPLLWGGIFSTHCAGCTHSLGPAERHTGDALDVLQTKLADGLACLLFIARVHGNGGACGDVALSLALGFGVRVCLLNLDVLLLRLVADLLNAWVRHGELSTEFVVGVVFGVWWSAEWKRKFKRSERRLIAKTIQSQSQRQVQSGYLTSTPGKEVQGPLSELI